jgi:hypothetical protein
MIQNIETKVCNIKVEFLRKPNRYGRTYDNAKRWCEDCNNVYIGRTSPMIVGGSRIKASIWANPFNLKDYSTRKECLDAYYSYIVNKIKSENLISELMKLKGKTLGCYCSPEQCHGDVLIYLINIIQVTY